MIYFYGAMREDDCDEQEDYRDVASRLSLAASEYQAMLDRVRETWLKTHIATKAEIEAVAEELEEEGIV